MKKTMTRNIVIMAIVTVIMAVVLSLYIKSTGTVPAADSTASLADGTYTASEQGCLSEVAVTVTVTGGKVTNVAIDASGETPELGGAAAETLADELTKPVWTPFPARPSPAMLCSPPWTAAWRRPAPALQAQRT